LLLDGMVIMPKVDNDCILTKDQVVEIIAHFGPIAQIDKMVEEASELILALIHFKSKKASHAQVIDEIADVLIMASQLRHIFDADQVDKRIDHKLERLQNKIKK